MMMFKRRLFCSMIGAGQPRWTWKFIGLSSLMSGMSGWCLYQVYLAKGNLLLTEVIISEKLKKLPLYPPPPLSSVSRSLVSYSGEESEIGKLFAVWFLSSDLKLPGGVTRGDVIEFFSLSEDDNNESENRRFLEKGRGASEEMRRAEGVSMDVAWKFFVEIFDKKEISDAGKLKLRKLLTGEVDDRLAEIDRIERETSELRSRDNLSEAEIERLDLLDEKIKSVS